MGGGGGGGGQHATCGKSSAGLATDQRTCRQCTYCIAGQGASYMLAINLGSLCLCMGRVEINITSSLQVL